MLPLWPLAFFLCLLPDSQHVGGDPLPEKFFFLPHCFPSLLKEVSRCLVIFCFFFLFCRPYDDELFFCNMLERAIIP